MNAHVQSQERREIMNVARRYRRDGYKVSGPDTWTSMPSFLGDAVPDLIAERDDDKVIVEVKRATTVRGSNNIVELAERVAAQPGWRFELIAISETNRIAMPDLVWIGEDVKRLVDGGFLKAAFVLVYATIENLVACAAVRHNRSPASASFPALVRDLVVRGIISEETRLTINEASERRNAILHAEMDEAPTKTEIKSLMSLCLDLEKETLAASKG